MNKLTLLAVEILATLLVTNSTVLAQSVWSGAGGNWSSDGTPGWNGSGVPDAVDRQVDTSAAGGSITVDGSFTLGTLLHAVTNASYLLRCGGPVGDGLIFDVLAGRAYIDLGSALSRTAQMTWNIDLRLDDELEVRRTTLVAGSGSDTCTFSLQGVLSGPGGILLTNIIMEPAVNGLLKLALSRTNHFSSGIWIGPCTALTLSSSGAAGSGPIDFSSVGTNSLSDFCMLDFNACSQTHTNALVLKRPGRNQQALLRVISPSWSTPITVTLSGPLTSLTSGYAARVRFLNAPGTLVLAGNNSGWGGELWVDPYDSGVGGKVIVDHVQALPDSVRMGSARPGNAGLPYGTNALLFNVAGTFSERVRFDGFQGTPTNFFPILGTTAALTGKVTLTNANAIDFRYTLQQFGLAVDHAAGILELQSGLTDGGLSRPLVKSGPGTAVLAGPICNWSGGTTVLDGTLQVGNGGTNGASGAASGGVTLAAGTTLRFMRSNTCTVSNAIGGTGCVQQAGEGTLVLQGTNTYSGATSVASGELRVDGALTHSAVSVSGARLSGHGAIGGEVTVMGGALAPGAAASCLITGALSFDSNAVYEVELRGTASAILHSRTLVRDGNTDLGAATLTVVDRLGYLPPTNRAFTVLTCANGTIGGRFACGDTVISDRGTCFAVVYGNTNIVLIARSGGAAIQPLAPLNRTSVQAALDAAGEGDVVEIPAGRHVIDGTLTMKESRCLRGFGMDASIFVKTGGTSTAILSLAAQSGKAFRITGLGFEGAGVDLLRQNPASTVLDSGISIFGNARDFVVDHCRFQGFSGYGLYIYGAGGVSLKGHAEGVVRDNRFIDLYYLGASEARGYGVGLYGDESWPPELLLGAPNVVFVENNSFERNRHCIAGNMGARYVFRNNTVVSNYYPFAAVDSHGKLIGLHGTRSVEVYDNSFTGGIEWGGTPHGAWALGLRGGDGVVYSNASSGMWRAMFLAIENLLNMGSPPYPVPDQTTNLWAWGNMLAGQTNDHFTIGYDAATEEACTPYLQLGRDYHEGSPMPGYAPFFYPHPLGDWRGHWTFDTAVSAQTDDSANGHQATLCGSVAAVAGKCGGALRFGAAGDRVQIPCTAALNTPEFTFSAWVKVEGGRDTRRTLVSSRMCSGSGAIAVRTGFAVAMGENNAWQFLTGSGTPGQIEHVLVGPRVSLGEWTHVAVTVAGGAKTLCIDGVALTGTATFAPNTAAPYDIGTCDNADTFCGVIDDVHHYARALTPDEIRWLYNRMPDGSIELGFTGPWRVRTGSPTLDTAIRHEGAVAVAFDKNTSSVESETSIGLNRSIPVIGGATYTISAWAKGSGLQAGTEPWHGLAVAGGWYDKNMAPVVSDPPPHLAMNNGTYDWRRFSVACTAPTQAAYYRVTAVGILQSGSGHAWVDALAFRPCTEPDSEGAPPRAPIQTLLLLQ
jgi:autotransporter-associated beta strand protein